MSTRHYPRLDIEEFSAELITSLDLDPVYSALVKMEMPESQLKRWLLAYFLCYHPGAASWLSEQEGTMYWGCLLRAAENELLSPLGERWPRAPERRHWRGKAAMTCAPG